MNRSWMLAVRDHKPILRFETEPLGALAIAHAKTLAHPGQNSSQLIFQLSRLHLDI